jgi:hypothetical protein
MSYGSPPLLHEDESSVKMPLDFDDNTDTCPGFDSLELREDGEYWPVTIGSYNRYKFQLYKIATSIMRDVYFTRLHQTDELVRRIRVYHKRLLDWERSTPPELRVESHSRQQPESRDGSLLGLFAIQAITLRITYDNVQLFLFRPFISLGSIPNNSHEHSQQQEAHNSSTSAPDVLKRLDPDGGISSQLATTAQSQCWTSAIRTSLIGEHLEILQSRRINVALVHIGAHCFSAGVMLALLALSNPLSEQSQESKRGIARLVQIHHRSKFGTRIWIQMTAVLTDLLHVIATEETRVLIDGRTNLVQPESNMSIPVFGSPPDMYRNNITSDWPIDSRTAQVPSANPGQVGNCNTADETLQRTMPRSNTGGLLVQKDGVPATVLERHRPNISLTKNTGILSGAIDLVPDLATDAPIHGETPPTELFGENIQGLSQMWMWDGSFSYC